MNQPTALELASERVAWPCGDGMVAPADHRQHAGGEQLRDGLLGAVLRGHQVPRDGRHVTAVNEVEVLREATPVLALYIRNCSLASRSPFGPKLEPVRLK
jgi:hypothetical protein